MRGSGGRSPAPGSGQWVPICTQPSGRNELGHLHHPPPPAARLLMDAGCGVWGVGCGMQATERALNKDLPGPETENSILSGSQEDTPCLNIPPQGDCRN